MQFINKTLHALKKIKSLRKKEFDRFEVMSYTSIIVIVLFSIFGVGLPMAQIVGYYKDFLFQINKDIIAIGFLFSFALIIGGSIYALVLLYLRKKDFLWKLFGGEKINKEQQFLLSDIFENKDNAYQLMKEIYSFSKKENENIQLETVVLIKQVKEAYVKKDEHLLEKTLREIFKLFNNPSTTNFEETFHQNFSQIVEIEKEMGQNNLNVNKYL